jgi:hemerythrin-like metal-binding protein
MTAMVPPGPAYWVSGRYRFVSVYFSMAPDRMRKFFAFQGRNSAMPILVHWDASFSVGNHLLDSQHQKLLHLCNQLAECATKRPVDAQFRFHDILHQLTQYARQHFQMEEGLLQKYDYAGLADQQAEHGAYEEKMADWAFSATMDTLDMQEVQRYLAVWWRDHILITDMQYKTLMESKR